MASQLKRFGTKYGGYKYPRHLPGLAKDSIIYSCGLGEDISHDVLLADECGATVWMFDPTPRAIEHVRRVKQVLTTREEPEVNELIGGGDPEYWKLVLGCQKIRPEQLVVFGDAVAIKTGMFEFYKPEEPYVSHTLIKGHGTSDYGFHVQTRSIPEIMRLLGHTKIDLLKLSVKGVECDILESLFGDNGVDFEWPLYLGIDFDIATSQQQEAVTRCNDVIKKLFTVGYTLLSKDEFTISFIRSNWEGAPDEVLVGPPSESDEQRPSPPIHHHVDPNRKTSKLSKLHQFTGETMTTVAQVYEPGI